MKKYIFSKGFVFVIICLFFGIGIQPVFADISNDSDESNMVEYTVQVGDIEHNVVLSSKQAKKLETLIDITKERLDNATTIEETSHVFDETVVSLNELGLLPDDMSVEDTQQIVKGNNRFPMIVKVLNRLSGSNREIFNNESNLFCLIAGETSNTFFYPLSMRILLYMMNNIENDLPLFLCYYLSIFLYQTLTILWVISPVVYGNNGCLGYKAGMIPTPSIGWVFTIGLNGINIWDGKFYGIIPIPFGFAEPYKSCVGIRGFTGISIYKDLNYSDCFYLGFTTQVKIEYA